MMVKKKLSTTEGGLGDAIKAAGGLRAFARLLGISRQAVLQWQGKIPADRIIEIEEKTGVARERLRPDIYRLPR